MSTADSSIPGLSIYQNLLESAARTSTSMLSQVLGMARKTLRTEVSMARGFLERDQLELSVKLMESHTPSLCERFPAILLDIFRSHGDTQTKSGVLGEQALRLDQLELMDEGQVQERVELARMLQHVLLDAELALPEFNSFVCALVGLDRVSPEHNPLRPDSYVKALQQLMNEMRVPTQVRAIWLRHLSAPLGSALREAYLQWSEQLRSQDVRRVGFTVIRTPEVATEVVDHGRSGRAERAVWTPEYRQTVLTLDKLRQLMSGHLDGPPDSPKEAFAQQFAREFEGGQSPDHGPETAFQATLPAALDALQEMQQVDTVVLRMQQRPAPPKGRATDTRPPGAVVREELTRSAKSMSQVLSLEVVSLMAENLIKDTRLLPQVRKIIERLEPALLRLVIVDPRFFIDKAHPARLLLNEISQRGLAFGSETDPDFEAFLLSLQRHVSPLAVLNIEGVQPFEAALKQLQQEWDNPEVRETVNSQIQSAAAALGYAEERNLLASQMANNMMKMSGMSRVPVDVLDFLCGPWSHVMAEAQLKAVPGTDDPGAYKALVADLLWSAQPDLTRKDVGRLTKLVPRLLSGLREGLSLIGYPSTKTSVFFDVLMKQHHQAFRPATQEEAAAPDGLDASLLGSQDHWVAPSEAKASGFMDFADEEVADQPKSAPLSLPPQTSTMPLAVGAWIELYLSGAWQRVQLSWISPHGTMYLFTNVGGKTQSMTQRFYERMLAEGKLRVVSDQSSMVDGALDAVVRTAMRNSIDAGS
ncbi:DUF1631 family protein [Rhodoferax sp. U11-2br]|uniref:DUF1631 family protein n=1 Tax=Rhodoferax sp. U11-2br TaxID=2838878 RepID=UPI001BE62184|nr:DUF1631 family protein [Rhodoferax sp. U11-2br]MBT3065739.1 DUF1631 family protein [Rhodoferax sp. U11-2br]